MEFAVQIGVDQSTVSDIENGAGFSADLLMRISEALEVSPVVVMRGHDETSWPFQFIAIEEFIGLDEVKRSVVEGRLMEFLSQVNPPNPPQGKSLKPNVRTQVTGVQRRGRS